MGKRIRKVMVGVAALTAFALGGAVFAQAQSSPSSAPERASAPDRDTIQSGDQTTPDKAGSAAGEQPGAGNPEQSGESAANSDGPGGHADEPGNPTADHQFQGNE